MSFVRYNMFLMFFLLAMSFSYAQELQRLDDSLFSGVIVHLTPKKPFAAELYLKNALKDISKTLLEDIRRDNRIDTSSSVFKDSVIVKLRSGVSWDITGNAPKNPIFFLPRLIVNKKNKALKKRLEYLKFNSLCEQKPDLVFLLIDSFEVYINNLNVKYKYVLTIDSENQLTVQTCELIE